MTAVALLHCSHYDAPAIVAKVHQLCEALRFRVGRTTRVLLKPNLLTARSADHLACTHPAFVAAVAEWFVGQGARVAIGDSPAFGTARGVMRATGIAAALAELPVELLDFDQSVPIRLAGGITVDMARAVLECDMLVNLPRIKAHSQLYVTLAIKNYFGTVVGFQKAWWHLRYGNQAERFASHLVDLLETLPPGITLVDGIVAMHAAGPVAGLPYSLGLVAGAVDPVALDTGLLSVLGLNHARSVLWRECDRRGLAGADPGVLAYPLLKPADFPGRDFKAPAMLKSLSFNPLRMVISGCRRFTARVKESS